MQKNFSRRRFVTTVSAAGITAFAGCGGGGDGGDGDTEEDNATGDNATGANESESDGLGGEDNETEDNETGLDDNETEDNETDENETNETGAEGSQAIRLGGETGGWQGEAPSDIEGETNPTLSLQAGTTYELTWENLDGEEHEIIIEDTNENELEASDESEEQGETVTLMFEATEEMATYYCEYHPEAMRGEITVE